MIRVLCILLLLSLLRPAHASDASHVLQARARDDVLTIFLDIPLQREAASCKVSNQAAQVLQGGLLLDGGAVRTTVLIDISGSIPKEMREKVLSAVDTLIEQKADAEAYRLVTFGEEERVLCDFTADRYDLSKAAEGIAFDGQWSKIYDAIHNTVSSAGEGSDAPTFYRTIVVTDGADQTQTGVTMEELFLKLQEERYPVDVLAVSDAAESTPNKELSAISRISNGRYCSLDPDTDLSGLGQALGVEGYSYLEVQVPEHLLDGSVRQVDLTDGAFSESLDVKFAAIYEQTVEPPEPEPEPEPGPEPELEPEQVSQPASFLEQNGILLAGLAAAAVVIIVVLALVLKGKKRKAPEPEPGIPPAPPRGGSAETVPFSGDAQYTIKVSAPRHPGQEWTLDLTDELLVGRAEHCQIQLTESTVSREQCKFVVQDGQLAVVHLGSNKTKVNGTAVETSCPLHSGDTLAFGREQLRIDYIQKLEPPAEGGGSPKAADKDPTESFF